MKIRLSSLSALLIVTIGLISCSSRPSPYDTMESYLKAWEGGRYGDMYDLLSERAQGAISRDRFVQRYQAITEGSTILSIKTSFVKDEKAARSLAGSRRVKPTEATVHAAATLEEMVEQIQAGEIKQLDLILKTDVQGSIEPIKNSLERLSDENVKVKVIHEGAGNVTESDVLLAQASNAIIIGFNVKAEPGARRTAEMAKIDIRLYEIIYNVVDDVKKALTGMLEPKYQDVVEGHAEVRQVFKIGKAEAAAGCLVIDGKISRTSSARVLRDGQSVFEGRMSSLRRFKDDVREVLTNFECGIGLEGFRDWQVGDVIESYSKERVS